MSPLWRHRRLTHISLVPLRVGLWPHPLSHLLVPHQRNPCTSIWTRGRSISVEGCKDRAKHSPANVSSVRLCRVWVPAAASMATEESATPLQCARSRRSSCGRWRCSSRRVASPTSRPERRSVVMFLSRLRDDSKPWGVGGGGGVTSESVNLQVTCCSIGFRFFRSWLDSKSILNSKLDAGHSVNTLCIMCDF